MGPSLLLWAGPSMLFRGQCPPVALPHPALAHLLAPLLLLKQVLASVAGPEQRLATQHLHLGDPAGIHGTSMARPASGLAGSPKPYRSTAQDHPHAARAHLCHSQMAKMMPRMDAQGINRMGTRSENTMAPGSTSSGPGRW